MSETSEMLYNMPMNRAIFLGLAALAMASPAFADATIWNDVSPAGQLAREEECAAYGASNVADCARKLEECWPAMQSKLIASNVDVSFGNSAAEACLRKQRLSDKPQR